MRAEIVLAIITAGGATAIVNGLFGLIKWLLDRKAKKADEAEEKEDITGDIQQDINEIKKTLEETRAAVNQLSGSMEDLRTADRYVMKDRIKLLANKYIDRRYITTEELEDLLQMHRVYHDILHGNGFLDALMDKVKALPVKNTKNE